MWYEEGHPMKKVKKLTFEAWMAMVNKIVSAVIIVDTSDLPDMPYSQWYEEGVRTTTAAKRAIREAGGDF